MSAERLEERLARARECDDACRAYEESGRWEYVTAEVVDESLRADSRLLKEVKTSLPGLLAEVVQLREALLEAQRLLASGHQDSRREAQDVIAAAQRVNHAETCAWRFGFNRECDCGVGA